MPQPLRSGGLLVAMALVIASAPSRGSAQDSPEEIEARALFTAGTAAYEGGRFVEAVEYFLRAHRLVPRESMLLNAAQSAWDGGLFERALELYARLEREAAEPEDRALAHERAEELRARLRPPEPAPAPAPPPAPPPAPSALPIVLTVAGAAVAVLGAVLLAVGVADAAAIADTPDGERAWSSVRGDLDRAYALEGVGAASLGLGLVSVGVGVGWWATSAAEPVERAAGLSVRGRW